MVLPDMWKNNKNCHRIHSILLLMVQAIPVFPQSCISSTGVSSIHLYPDNFRGASPLNQDTCTVQQTGELICLEGTTLLDGNSGPNKPDINSVSDLSHFAAWSHQHTPIDTLYLSIRQQAQELVAVTAIDIYILNYPRERIGVPNFLMLYGTPDQQAQRFDASSNGVVLLDYDLVNNNLLSQSDSRVRRITLRFRESSRQRRYVITWNFSGLYSVEWLLVSEVQLCTNTQPNFRSSQVQFLNPAANLPIAIQPTAAVLASGTLELSCTVSNEGSFNWVWRKETDDLSSSSKTKILSADGTRTSVLLISRLRFEDYGEYRCIVAYKNTATSTSRQRNILFPLMIEVAVSRVSAVKGDNSVSLNCEVYGYATFLNSQRWTDSDGVRITAGAKYGLSFTSGSGSLTYANGTIRPNVLSTLTIRSVTLQDGGRYWCRVDTVTAETLVSSVLLTVSEVPTVIAPPAPSSSPPSISTIETTMVMPQANVTSISDQLEDVAMYVVPLPAVAIAVILLVDFILCIYCIKKCRQRMLVKLETEQNPSTTVVSSELTTGLTTEVVDYDNTIDQASLLESSFTTDDSFTRRSRRRSRSRKARSRHRAGSSRNTSMVSGGDISRETSLSHTANHDVTPSVSHAISITISHEGDISREGSVTREGSLSQGSFSYGGSVSQGSFSRGGSVSHGGSVSRGGSVSQGSFSRGGSVSHGGSVSRGGSVSHGGSVSRGGSVSHGGSVSRGVSHGGSVSRGGSVSVSHQGSTKQQNVALKLNEQKDQDVLAPTINVHEPTLVDDDLASDADRAPRIGRPITIEPMSFDDDDEEEEEEDGDPNFLSPNFY